MIPKISILMTVYNGEQYLKQAIDSILSQSFKEFEFIIVNDGSKDKSPQILSSYSDPRIIVVNNPQNLGLIKSLNIGLGYCHSKYTARLDHDDISLPNRLHVQYEFMEKNPEIDIVGSWTECIDTNNNPIKISRNPSDPSVIQYELLFNNVMFHSSIFFRTELIKKFGGYSQQFPHSEDYEMYSRLESKFRCANIPQVLFKLRLHNQSITGSQNTQPTVHVNALNIAFRNINQYLPLSRQDFDQIKEILIIKKPSLNTSFLNLIKALKILKKLTNIFIEKNHLSKEKSLLIKRNYYSGRKKMMWKHYLIGKYRLIQKRS